MSVDIFFRCNPMSDKEGMMETVAELTVTAGNAAFRVWEAMPEPKLDYVQWYYGTREQSLSEALEQWEKGGDDADNE